MNTVVAIVNKNTNFSNISSKNFASSHQIKLLNPIPNPLGKGMNKSELIL
jgi:hypothetical protein